MVSDAIGVVIQRKAGLFILVKAAGGSALHAGRVRTVHAAGGEKDAFELLLQLLLQGTSWSREWSALGIRTLVANSMGYFSGSSSSTES